jgi:hypothetical protein
LDVESVRYQARVECCASEDAVYAIGKAITTKGFDKDTARAIAETQYIMSDDRINKR